MTSYWRSSRAARYSVLFAVPLLVFYEVLAATLPSGIAGLRNGADVIIKSVFIALAGAWGLRLFEVSLIGVGLWLVVRDMRRHGARLSGVVFAGMLAEAVALALVVGVLVGGATTKILQPLGALARPAPPGQDPWTLLMLSLGAGLYEELLFRVVLVGALAWTARELLRWQPTAAGTAAVLVGASIFATFHYIGPYGDAWGLYSFVFRLIAGVFFSTLYVLRGFGITAWTHALYDVFLLVRL